MTTPYPRTRIAIAVAGVAMLLGASQAFGAGFALQENSGSGLGNAFAGGAAVAEDASTIWANPAGMSRIGTNQVVGTIYLLTPSMKFSNNASQPAAVCPQGVTPLCGPSGIYQPLGGDGGDAGSLNVVPNLYLLVPINKQWAFGLGINAPFGLVTEYDSSWLGRYQAIKSDIQTINVNPAFSYKIDNFTFGAGASYQHIKATLSANLNYSGGIGQATLQGAAAGLVPVAAVNPLLNASTGLDANANVEGSDDAWGWNVGMLWEVDRNTRIGASYRSSIKYNVTGNVDISTPPAPTLPATLAPIYAAVATQVNASPLLQSGGVYSNIELPQSANLSIFSSLNDKWDIMADVQWTGWSSIQDLTFYRTNGTLFSSTPEKWKDVWRVAVGSNYKYSDQWKFRFGAAWDQSPVSDQYRTPRLPDGDRIWLATGAQYKMDRNWVFDVGLAYGWAPSNPSINQNAGNTDQFGLINGDYKVSFLIVSGQVAYSW